MIDVALSLVALIGAGVSLELFTAGATPAPSAAGEGLFLIPEVDSSAEEVQSGNPS
jgi:hypothetical protein